MKQAARDRSPRPRRQWWALLRRSLSRNTADATRGPLGETLALLAVPMALEMVLEGVFAVTDIIFVARLGKEAVATVGLTDDDPGDERRR
jgi:hypothetical protein